MKEYRPLLAALAVMALLTPVGVYLPELVKGGAAWGEWGVGEIRNLIGYAPREMEKSADAWKAPLPGYSLPGRKDDPPGRGLAYVASAFVGIAACGGCAYLVARRLAARGGRDDRR